MVRRIHLTEEDVLHRLRIAKKASVSELAKQMDMDTTTTQFHLSLLERDGFINTELEFRKDSRGKPIAVVCYSLSDGGKLVIQRSC